MIQFMRRPPHPLEPLVLSTVSAGVILAYGIETQRDLMAVSAIAVTIAGATWVIGSLIIRPDLKVWTTGRLAVALYASGLAALVAVTLGFSLATRHTMTIVQAPPIATPITYSEIHVMPCASPFVLRGPGPAGSYVCEYTVPPDPKTGPVLASPTS